MGILVSIRGIRGGTFKRRLMKFQGKESMDGGGFYNTGLNSLDNMRELAAFKLWGMGPEKEKRQNWRK